jgi:hypothetical protein
MIKRIVIAIKTGTMAAINELHDSGEWTDLEMAMDSKNPGGPSGKTWYFTAMAMAAMYKQLELMRWLIEKGAKVNEDREWHYLPSNTAATAGFIEGLELLKEKGCDRQRQTAQAVRHLPALRLLHSFECPLDCLDNEGSNLPHFAAGGAGHEDTTSR